MINNQNINILDSDNILDCLTMHCSFKTCRAHCGFLPLDVRKVWSEQQEAGLHVYGTGSLQMVTKLFCEQDKTQKL